MTVIIEKSSDIEKIKSYDLINSDTIDITVEKETISGPSVVTETFSARRRGSSPETWVQLGNQSPDIGSTGVSLMVQESRS